MNSPRRQEVFDLHIELLDAVEQRDPERAKAISRQLIELGRHGGIRHGGKTLILHPKRRGAKSACWFARPCP